MPASIYITYKYDTVGKKTVSLHGATPINNINNKLLIFVAL